MDGNLCVAFVAATSAEASASEMEPPDGHLLPCRHVGAFPSTLEALHWPGQTVFITIDEMAP